MQQGVPGCDIVVFLTNSTGVNLGFDAPLHHRCECSAVGCHVDRYRAAAQ